MPLLEKLAQQQQARHWPGSIPLEYHYTAGVAGEEFLRELKENGRFLASKCLKCRSVYVPARMYCPTCFVETKDRLPVREPGLVHSYTSVSRDRAGSQLPKPMIIALVKFEGVKGGIVHKLDVDGPDKVAFGMKVAPVLKEPADRTGSLTDILSFKPL